MYTYLLRKDFLPDQLTAGTAALALLVLLLIGSKKTGIACYDVILTAVLAMLCSDLIQQIKFAAGILILWGAAGAILRLAFKKPGTTKIPLSPIILTAYLILFIPRLP